MLSEARLKFLKKLIILGPKTAILGPQFCRILVLGPHFWWSGGARAPGAPLDPPLLRQSHIANTSHRSELYEVNFFVYGYSEVVNLQALKIFPFWD